MVQNRCAGIGHGIFARGRETVVDGSKEGGVPTDRCRNTVASSSKIPIATRPNSMIYDKVSGPGRAVTEESPDPTRRNHDDI
jgi:hypothetical protein